MSSTREKEGEPIFFVLHVVILVAIVVSTLYVAFARDMRMAMMGIAATQFSISLEMLFLDIYYAFVVQLLIGVGLISMTYVVALGKCGFLVTTGKRSEKQKRHASDIREDTEKPDMMIETPLDEEGKAP